MIRAATTLSVALLAILPALFAETRAESDVDIAAGEALYERCQGCHSIDRNRIGPMHRGLFGRTAGTLEGFEYSEAMRNSGIVWDEATLDAFLEAPRNYVPGTKMTYAGVKDAQERRDLIAYLRQASAP
ncbi:MAG: cytochrome c family protein [Dongiaceae bacterium]